MRSSVYNSPYTEKISLNGTKGLFQSKIASMLNYKAFISDLKQGKIAKNPYRLTFSSAMNKDLFISLHNCSAYYTKNSLSDVYSVRIYDIYDFALDNDYDSVLVSCVNNAAWLSQQTNALHKINVNIYMQ